MLQHVPSWSSFSQGIMPGGHHHPGLSKLDENNLAMQEPLGEREDEASKDYLEELEFEILLESTLAHTAWYAAPFYTYGYHEEDQFMDTLNYTHQEDDLSPTYYSPWNAPIISAPEYRLAA